MLKNLSSLQAMVNGKLHQYFLDVDSQIPDVKEFLLACLKYVGNVEDQVKAQQEAAKSEGEAQPVEAAEPKPDSEQPKPE